MAASGHTWPYILDPVRRVGHKPNLGLLLVAHKGVSAPGAAGLKCVRCALAHLVSVHLLEEAVAAGAIAD